MSEAGEIVGMVDVLKLTYATLDQVNMSYPSRINALTCIDQQYQHNRQRRPSMEQILAVSRRRDRIDDVW